MFRGKILTLNRTWS